MAAKQVNAEEIKRYLIEVNEELRSMDVKGEICLYGGAVMALAYKAVLIPTMSTRSLNPCVTFE